MAKELLWWCTDTTTTWVTDALYTLTRVYTYMHTRCPHYCFHIVYRMFAIHVEMTTVVIITPLLPLKLPPVPLATERQHIWNPPFPLSTLQHEPEFSNVYIKKKKWHSTELRPPAIRIINHLRRCRPTNTGYAYIKWYIKYKHLNK